MKTDNAHGVLICGDGNILELDNGQMVTYWGCTSWYRIWYFKMVKMATFVVYFAVIEDPSHHKFKHLSILSQSVPLIYVTIFVQDSYCFDYCGFMTSGNRYDKSFNSFPFSKCFGYLRWYKCIFHIHCKISLSISTGNSADFDRYWAQSTDKLGEGCHIESPNPWTIFTKFNFLSYVL